MGNHIDQDLGTHYGNAFKLDDIVDAVVRFANGDVRPIFGEESPFKEGDGSPPHLVGHYLGGRNGQLLAVPRAVAVREFEERTDRSRAYAVEVLGVAAQGSAPLSKLVRSFKPWDSTLAASFESSNEEMDFGDLALYATLKFSADGHPKLGWRISGPSDGIDQWVRIAAAMVADAARGKATSICRCQLPSCGRFFQIVRSGPGKPSTKYCPGTNHMELAHQANSTLRSQRKRRQDRLRQQRPKRGK